MTTYKINMASIISKLIRQGVYIQLRMGYWKESVYRTKSKSEIIEGAFDRWKESGLNPYKNK